MQIQKNINHTVSATSDHALPRSALAAAVAVGDEPGAELSGGAPPPDVGEAVKFAVVRTTT